MGAAMTHMIRDEPCPWAATAPAVSARNTALSRIDFVVLAYLRVHDDAVHRAELNGHKIPDQHAEVLRLLRAAAMQVSKDHLFPLEAANSAAIFDSRNRGLARVQITINKLAARFRELWSKPEPSVSEVAIAFRAISTEIFNQHYNTNRRMWSD